MDFLVLSHLRWDFVFQRPQHLMSRCAHTDRVFFWEEPIYDAAENAYVNVSTRSNNLHVAVPHLPAGLEQAETWEIQESLLHHLISQHGIHDFALWYYTPMARHFSRKLNPSVVVYDCMDELSGFRGAPPGLRGAEAELFLSADLVFTGGQSLYERKKFQHPAVHCFPSSIDREFFAKARHVADEPGDQAHIPHPRLGFCGVIDERMDTDLVAAVAERRPDWHIVLLGPVVKISQSELPQGKNIHYLGAKNYRTLPSYLAGWDLGLLPFARNDSTRFISPTKTPEYLAAGLPVVSTPIHDVVNPYGAKNLVEIASTADEFIECAERAIASRNDAGRLAKADRFLSQISWDLTWSRMKRLIDAAAHSNHNLSTDDSASRGTSAAAD